MRTPTLKQAARLRVLGSGLIVVTPRRSDWGPLLRHGGSRSARTPVSDPGARVSTAIRCGSRPTGTARSPRRSSVTDTHPGPRGPRRPNDRYRALDCHDVR
jgi:hypothetical protein